MKVPAALLVAVALLALPVLAAPPLEDISELKKPVVVFKGGLVVVSPGSQGGL
ncbi:MAG TPA: hypothetical protein VKK31_04970 [Thermoanaerobaculia bacterium]|nr:hypothetical protein [Thermoanaerobaculia bacterium]